MKRRRSREELEARLAELRRECAPKRPGLAKSHVGTCCFCGRVASTCWVMPCLELDTALRWHDDAEMKRWAAQAGVGLTKNGRPFAAVPATAGDAR